VRHEVEIDVLEFLEGMGMRNVSVKGENIIFSCPFPGHQAGDKTPSAGMNIQTTQWQCWGCKRKGNAITFVSLYEGVSPMKARRWLREKWGAGFREPKTTMRDELESWVVRAGQIAAVEEFNYLPESELERYHVNWGLVEHTPSAPWELRYMIDRGFTADTLTRYQIGWCGYRRRVMLPIREETGLLVGFKGRAVDADVHPRYMIYGYLATKVLYLAHDVVPEDGNVGVVEGELNALMLRQQGFRHATGISGSVFSMRQAEIVKAKGESCTFVFDGDESGTAGQWNAVELLMPFMPVYVAPPHDKDPAESSREENAYLLSNARSPLTLFTD
jgi:DNA primase